MDGSEEVRIEPGAGAGAADLSEARDLVLRAYAAASSAGRPEWRHMSVAVLKNRLLDMTDRQFNEAQWGATTTSEFVLLLDDLLTLDTSTKPATAVLREEISVEAAASVTASETARRKGGWRIRRDLWNAIVDFSSGLVYVWDGANAVIRAPEEAPGDGRSVLPTVTVAEFTAWRAQFAEEMQRRHADEATRLRIEEWRDSNGSGQALPPAIRNQWYGALKQHVRARLEEWFAERAQSPPRDLVHVVGQSAGAADETEKMRQLVVHAVERMTRAELEGLNLPVSSLLDRLS